MRTLAAVLVLLALGFSVSVAQTLLGVTYGSNIGGSPSPACNGTIDLGSGCPQPMLGY